MKKSQFKLFYEILNRFQKEGILKDVILIGSWCVPLYKDHYLKESQIPPLRTLDIDFLVPLPLRGKTKHNIPDLLLDLGFVQDFVGSQGFIRLVHPDLMLEFLVHEKGRGEEKAVDLKNFGINAQPGVFQRV